MKRAILMSIRKEYMDLIRAGRKTCEYRTNLPAELRVKTMKILLYETKATGGAGAIIGQAVCAGWWLVWDPAYNIDFIPEDATEHEREYIMNTDGCYALHLREIRFYDKPVPLSRYGVKKAPQSYMYIDEEVGPMT